MKTNYYDTNKQTRNIILRRFSMFDGVGMDLNGAETYDEALKACGLDYTGKCMPLALKDVGVEVPDHFAVVKTNEDGEIVGDDVKIMGVVGNQYTPVSNRTAFEIAEEIVNEGAAHYEVGGPSFRNKNVVDFGRSFLALRGDDFEIGDDVYNSFILFNNSFDGSSGVSYRVLCQRVVCMNGMVRLLGGKKSQLYIKIQHSESAVDKIRIAGQVIRKRLEDVKLIQEEAKQFIALGMTKRDFETKVIPFALGQMNLVENEQERKRGQERIDRVVSQLLQAYNADDVQNYANSAYRAILALSDFETHSAPLRDLGNGQVYLNRVTKGMLLTTAVANYVVNNFTARK